MKLIERMFLAAVLVLAGFVIGCLMRSGATNSSLPPVTSYDMGPMLEQIHTMSSLTTLRVEVAGALVTELQGRTGGVQAVLVIHGEVMIGADLSEARLESVNDGKRIAILRLPQPTVQSQSLSPSRTKVVCLTTTGLWMIVPGGSGAETAATNLAYQEAQRAVGQAANDPIFTRQSRQQTELIIRSFAQPLHWTIDVRWDS